MYLAQGRARSPASKAELLAAAKRPETAPNRTTARIPRQIRLASTALVTKRAGASPQSHLFLWVGGTVMNICRSMKYCGPAYDSARRSGSKSQWGQHFSSAGLRPPNDGITCVVSTALALAWISQ